MIDVSSTAMFWVLGSGAPWRDLPECYGPYTTCYNRFVRWRGELAYGGRPFHQSGLLAPAGAGLSLNNEDAQAKACRIGCVASQTNGPASRPGHLSLWWSAPGQAQPSALQYR